MKQKIKTEKDPQYLTFTSLVNSSAGKESTWNSEDLGLILGLGRSPGEGNCYLLQYSFLDNSMDREAWQGTVHGVARIQLRDFHFHFLCKYTLEIY